MLPRTVCTFTLQPSSFSFQSAGGTGAVTIGSQATGCAWAARSNDAFISITSGSAGNRTELARSVAGVPEKRLNGHFRRRSRVRSSTFLVALENGAEAVLFLRQSIYTALPWRSPSCSLSFVGTAGVRHSVDVTAESLYEAAILGVAARRAGG